LRGATKKELVPDYEIKNGNLRIERGGVEGSIEKTLKKGLGQDISASGKKTRPAKLKG